MLLLALMEFWRVFENRKHLLFKGWVFSYNRWVRATFRSYSFITPLLYRSNCNPPKIHWLKSNPQYLWVWPYLETGSLQRCHVKVRSSVWAPTPDVLLKRRNLETGRHTGRTPHEPEDRICKPRRETWDIFFPRALKKQPTLSTPWSRSSSLQNCGTIN